MSDAPNFRRGTEAAKEAAKGGGHYARTHFFGLEDGKFDVLRFLTEADNTIVVDQHQMVPTKPKPADYPKDAKWPDKMGCVCRKDSAFSYGECYICDFVVDGKKVKKPSGRSWALACRREEVMENGQVVGLRDKTREVTIPEKDGKPEKTIVEKDIIVVNMGYKNFFAILEGFAGRYKTLLDRDYWIKRSGSDETTTYQIVPMDPVEMESGRFDLREPEFMARYETDLNLATIITERASDEFYARFFDPRFETGDDGKVVPTGTAVRKTDGPESPSGDVDDAKMAELANRVKGYGNKPAEAPAAKDEPAVEEKPPGAPVPAGGMRDFS